jgi:MFS family permease
MAAALMPTSRLVPRLVRHVEPRWVCAAGLVLLALGLLVVAQVDATSSYWLLLAGLLPIGAGMGAAMTPATTAITESLPPAQQGIGSAMNDLARELGGALGIAVAGSLLSSVYRDSFRLPVGAAPREIADRARESFASATQAGGPIERAGSVAFVDGMHAALLVCSVVAVGTAIAVAMLMPRGTRVVTSDDG